MITQAGHNDAETSVLSPAFQVEILYAGFVSLTLRLCVSGPLSVVNAVKNVEMVCVRYSSCFAMPAGNSAVRFWQMLSDDLGVLRLRDLNGQKSSLRV